MRLGSKGQGAMEYLMTYGWAILVVMIVGVVLWQLGVFNPGTGQATTVGFYKLKPLSQADVVFSKANGFSAVFVNGAGTSITITNAVLTINTPSGAVCNERYGGLPGATQADFVSNDKVAIGQGGTFILNMTDCNSGGELSSSGTYTANMQIFYETEVGGFQRDNVENGTVQGPLVA